MKKVLLNFLMLFSIITYSQNGIHKNEEGVFYVQFSEEIETKLKAEEMKKIVAEKLKKDFPTINFTEEGKDFFQYQGGFRVKWNVPMVGYETVGVSLRCRTEFKDGKYRITWENFRIGQEQEPLNKFYDSAKERKQKAIDEKISESIVETKDYIIKAINESTNQKKDEDKW